MTTSIPIENFYYLFCYAWRHYEEGSLIDVGRVQNPTLPNLFATVLIQGLQRLLRRGMDRGYNSRTDDLFCLRGKLEVSETIKRCLMLKRKARCSFDELEYDIPSNQILKSTLTKLCRTEGLDRDAHNNLLRLRRYFDTVSDVRVTPWLFRQVHVHRNNRTIAFLIRVCEFVQHSLLPEARGRRSRFPDILRDEKKMAKVFESFVSNFYATEQFGFGVGSDHFKWCATASLASDLEYLPWMKTDISLRSTDRTIIIDTKYYREAFQLQERYGSKSIRSENLYQLFSYLKNLEERGGNDATAEGILLYPAVNEEFDLSFEMHRHKIRVRSLNLAQDWRGIRRDLLSILDPPKAP